MSKTLPPLPALPPAEVQEWSESWITLRGEGWTRETVEKYASDYALAAIEAQGVPVVLMALSDINELLHCNGMSVFVENPRIYPPYCEGEPLVGFVPLYTHPAPQAKPLTDVPQIAEALRKHGLTLIKTANGYDAIKLGECVAHGIKE